MKNDVLQKKDVLEKKNPFSKPFSDICVWKRYGTKNGMALTTTTTSTDEPNKGKEKEKRRIQPATSATRQVTNQKMQRRWNSEDQ